MECLINGAYHLIFCAKVNYFRYIIRELLMTESQNSPSVSVALIKILKNYAERLEIDFTKIAGVADVDVSILGDERARISARQFELMWQQIFCLR